MYGSPYHSKVTHLSIGVLASFSRNQILSSNNLICCHHVVLQGCLSRLLCTLLRYILLHNAFIVALHKFSYLHGRKLDMDSTYVYAELDLGSFRMKGVK